MAIEQPGFSIGFMEAAANLSDGSGQFKCVKATADKTFGVCSVAGEPSLGVLQDRPKQGSPGNIMITGVTKIVVGAGDLAAGAQWETAADGTGITCTAAKSAMGTVLIGAVAGKLATVTVGIATGATKA